MDHPIWLLIPWLVFACGVGFKVWTLTRLIHRQLLSSAWGIERFRKELERNWQRSGSVPSVLKADPSEPQQVRQTASQ